MSDVSPKLAHLPPDQYLAAVRAGMRCHDHETNARLVRREIASGAKLAGWQCATCGKWSAVDRAAVRNFESLPLYDERVRDAFWYAELEQRRSEGEAELEEKRRQYSAYLQSDKWRRKRAAVLDRDSNKCQACLVRTATEVHHTSYRHIYDEPLFELVAICRECHEKITEMDNDYWGRIYGRSAQ